MSVVSPTTHKTYTVACSVGAREQIACRTTDAVVTLSFDAVSNARKANPARPAPQTESPGEHGNSERIEQLEAEQHAQRRETCDRLYREYREGSPTELEEPTARSKAAIEEYGQLGCE
jgi:hypothetical protein